MSTFKQFELHDSLIQALEKMGVTVPTPIQEMAIPPGLEGQDIIASAQTGTGKTIAFSIPLIVRLMQSEDSTALILTPTRELAVQIKKAITELLWPRSPFRMSLLIGGESMGRQFAELRARPRLIVGTPGRIADHLNRGSLSLKNTRFLVIDETDRMLEMGFAEQLDAITESLPKERQTFMFSATLAPRIVKLSQRYLNNPKHITVGASSQPAPKIKQEVVEVSSTEKFPVLIKQLESRTGSIIVFVKTKRRAAQLATQIRRHDQSVDAIHGDLRQRERDHVMKNFRGGMCRIMVATDIVARGLDVPHVQHVINYDLPQCSEDYIHRIGRTARAGAEGNALCLVAPEDSQQWRMINRALNPKTAGQEPEGRFQSQRPRRGGFGGGGGGRGRFSGRR